MEENPILKYDGTHGVKIIEIHAQHSAGNFSPEDATSLTHYRAYLVAQNKRDAATSVLCLPKIASSRGKTPLGAPLPSTNTVPVSPIRFKKTYARRAPTTSTPMPDSSQSIFDSPFLPETFVGVDSIVTHVPLSGFITPRHSIDIIFGGHSRYTFYSQSSWVM